MERGNRILITGDIIKEEQQMHFMYSYLLILIVLIGCQKSIDIDKTQEVYYCVVFEQGGTRMIKDYRVASYEKLLKEKTRLKKGKDAYYYKIEDDLGKKVIYAYSIKNHNLEKILKTDNKKRLVHIAFPTRGINCTQKYITNDNAIKVVRECSNGDKRIEYYKYNKKLEIYTPKKRIYYKNNIVNETVIYKNGTTNIYDNYNNLLESNSSHDIAISDLCVPYIEHNMTFDIYSD